MNLQLLVALLPYLSLGVSIIVFLGLFCELSRRIQKLGDRISKLEPRIYESTAKSNEINVLERRLEELESGAAAGEPAAARPRSLNGTVRSKVLKMHRLGQPPERIADTLKVPKGEVDLLVKVHRIVMRPYEELPAGKGEGEVS
jgi:hypothetical protein